MKNKSGFTLIELLAVIVILAIILLIAVPNILDVIEGSRADAYEANTKMIEDAAKLYMTKNDTIKTVTVQTLVDEGYLKELPEDPRNGSSILGMVVIANGEIDYKMSQYNGTHNTPEITDNMYPVKWNGSSWVVTTKDDGGWYTYNGDIANSGDLNDGIGAFTADQWANIHITTESLSSGDLINESDLNLYVWIPRYTYLLNEPAKTIAIKYSNGATDDNTSNYLSHPGFSFGDMELTGIWVAKFEMSADTASDDYGTPSGAAIAVSRPNAKPWRNINVNNIFNEARTIEAEFSLDADTHMMKSSEWAAVAYLTEAIRDGEEVWINNQGWYDSTNTANNYKFITTGCAGTARNAGDNNATSAQCPTNYDYKTGGLKASTTGNIYGIYDMSGGTYEYVATYINDDTGSRLSSTSYAKALADADNRYKEMFDVAEATDVLNYNATADITKGLAFHETSTSATGGNAWYSNYSYYLQPNNPVVLRGGLFNASSAAGMFAFYRIYGGTVSTVGWRAVGSL